MKYKVGDRVKMFYEARNCEVHVIIDKIEGSLYTVSDDEFEWKYVNENDIIGYTNDSLNEPAKNYISVQSLIDYRALYEQEKALVNILHTALNMIAESPSPCNEIEFKIWEDVSRDEAIKAIIKYEQLKQQYNGQDTGAASTSVH